MTRLFPAKHADTHRPVGFLGPSDPGGSDPIQIPAGGSGIQFNVGTYGPDNVGDWTKIETSDKGPGAP